MRLLAAALIASAAIAVNVLFAAAAPTGGNCAEWAAEIGDPRDSYRMRQLGCYDPVPGEYVARPGICNQIARQGARAGLRGHDVVVYVRGKESSCYWEPTYRNYAVAHSTQGG